MSGGFLDLIYANADATRAKPATGGKASGFYSSPEWRALRRDKLRRDPYCEIEGCGAPAEHVDHVESVATHPDRALDAANVQSLCRSHHSSKTATVDAGFGNRRRGADEWKPTVRGCDANGRPLDPNHPWNK